MEEGYTLSQEEKGKRREGEQENQPKQKNKKKKRVRSVEHSPGRKPRNDISFRFLACWKKGQIAVK